MDSSLNFPETYRNCFKVPHYICSIIICVIFFAAAVAVFCLSVFGTSIVDNIYNVGGYPTRIRICGSIISILLACNNCFLAYGVAKEWALMLLVWIIVCIILWNLHFILIITSATFFGWDQSRRGAGAIASIVLIFSLQVLWLFLIIMVGRHWYAVCEEIYQQEFGETPRGISRRMYNISNRSRTSQSHYSTRIPQVLHRIEQRRNV